MASDINDILWPKILSSLRDNTPPVKCIIWKGGNQYETITFDTVYPFDTIDTIKRMICDHYRTDSTFIPRFTFVGIPLDNNDGEYSDKNPTIDTDYNPIDYLWFPTGTNDPKLTYRLKNPLYTLTHPDMRFVTSDGSYSSPNYAIRGRSTIEQVFLKPRDGKIPVLHVFTLATLMREYRGTNPIAEEDWNKRFAPYFPDIKMGGPYEANADDIEFSEKIHYFINQRQSTMYKIDGILESAQELPEIRVSGIRQLLLTWKKPVKGFEGSASLFYRIPVTEKRPYIRLLPAEGTGITKLHVKGVLPIPTLDDPRILEVWGKETSPTPGMDFCSFKYIHRPSIGITQPIYGTVHVYNDGTINLLLQPPKQIRKLDPTLDFRNFTTILTDVFSGLPQTPDSFILKELAILFTLKTEMKSKKFNKTRLLQRLPLFHSVFKEINPLPDESPILSLRYKAVSQYASEDKIMSFITQIATNKSLDGESPDTNIIFEIQNEFQFSKKEATDAFADWFKKRGTFTLQLPEDGEFIESFNPGIDIHIYAQHPSYYFHINRIDNIETYIRIYTLLTILFMDDDEYFKSEMNNIGDINEEVETESLQREEGLVTNTAAKASVSQPVIPSRSAIYINMDALEYNEDEVLPETAPNPIDAATAMDVPKKKGPPVGKLPELQDQQAQVKQAQVKQAQVKKVKQDESEQKMINPTSWFIKKLQEIDPRLFDYKTDASDENGYSRKCAGYDDRQPSILTKDQYDHMREVYEDDPIFWLIYPLEGTEEPIQPLGSEETITIMRYGSHSDSIHYYFCPQYYCLNDEIMIREVDFEATTDRDGNAKPENSCPFCYGKLITDRKKANIGYTVIKRKDKKGSTYHSYVDFMKKTTHPEGFALPCCFLKQTSLRIADPQFAHIRDSLQEEAVEETIENEEPQEDEQDYEELLLHSGEAIEYAVLFETMYKKYILESNKHPDPGIFATIPQKFDIFFRQNSSDDIVTRVAIHLKLRPNAQGFLRIGTENTLYESLLGVIAPLIYRNSIQEVKLRIVEVVVPRIFINAHFGNLVLEFFNPADGRAMPPTKQELAIWSQRELGIAINSTNLYPLLRAYNAYKRFVQFIKDPTQRKDLRHIQPLLAEPGLFTTRGLQLLIMEDNGADPITIKCPVFGISMDRHKTNDVAFISRSLKTIGSTESKYARYELYVHTSNMPAKGGEGDVHENIIRWDNTSRRIWPEMVKQRIDEYMTQCQSRYRSIYTSQEGVNSMAIIPLSKAVESSPVRPEGIVKDSYNHIVAVTFRSKPGSPFLVVLPVVDDGIVSISAAFSIKNIYLDWEDFKPAPVEDVILYYKNKLEPLFSLYPGYRVKFIAKQKMDNKIVAVQLENGIYIPAAASKDETQLAGFQTVSIERFQWMIDKELAGMKSKTSSNNWNTVLDEASVEKSCGTDSELLRKSSYVEFEELYQQFRLMVSNWLTGQKAGSEGRKGIEDIIFNKDLPEYERRKRLHILISSTLISWFYPDKESWEKVSTSFLRKDCRILGKESCTGTCYWKEDEGKCLLHVHAETNLGERSVSTPELFTKRIIDELVRFPVRRKQLIPVRRKQLMREGEISKVSAIINPIRQGDQYIIPESSLTWTNLLRLDWVRQVPEETKYYEEMTKEEDEKQDNDKPQKNIPAELEEIIGEDSRLQLKVPDNPNPLHPLLPFTSIFGLSLDQLGLSSNATTMTRENLIKYVRLTSRPIGMITINQTNENKIQFVKPWTGSFDAVTILVFLQDKIGLLIEEDGNPTVKLTSLTEPLLERWKAAGLIQFKKKVEPIEEPILPIVVGQNPVQVKKKKPLVGKLPQAIEPLVPVAPVAPPIAPVIAPVARRKPRAGILQNPLL